MDEAMLKSGQFPNVAIMAGTDPAEVMREHGREVIPDGEKYELADTREQLLNGIFGSKSEKTPEIARQDGVLNISDVQDTREKLETDILFEYLEFPGDQNRIFAYLDRQAAITRAECKNTLVHFAERLQLVQNGHDAAVRDMQPKVDELTAERDQLKADLKTANDTCNTLRASVAGLKMTVERFKARESREPADMGN